MELENRRVSVVIATYNRSNVLRFAIETVRWQTHRNWELLVVGDGCTDDTVDVVGSFEDPRIRFINLPENFGEQSRPNNIGCELASGRYVAFLNHDDLWWPDHLEHGLQALAATGADVVFAEMLCLQVGGSFVFGRTRGGCYDPNEHLPASSWLVRETAVREVGPWRPFGAQFSYPSQEWLFRAWWAGTDARYSPRWIFGRFSSKKQIRSTGHLTALHIPSTLRPNSYRDRDATEHQRYFELIASGATPRDLDANPWIPQGWWLPPSMGRLQGPVLRCVLSLGIAPCAVRMFVRNRGRRGKELDILRRSRGLHQPNSRQREGT